MLATAEWCRYSGVMNDPGRPLTHAEAAKLLGVTGRVLARWRSEGWSPPYYRLPVSGKGHGQVRYMYKELAAWIEENTTRPLAADEGGDEDGYY